MCHMGIPVGHVSKRTFFEFCIQIEETCAVQRMQRYLFQFSCGVIQYPQVVRHET